VVPTNERRFVLKFDFKHEGTMLCPYGCFRYVTSRVSRKWI
jgi:hypothetical protein